ncbi:MAG: hypothetical protein IJ370_02145 [Oscillospiraceae bacterium]|nr:hypothetical protein [Oscillospiraceae bacterium]
MKKDKKQNVYAWLEAITELILTLICLVIGIAIVGLFGVDFESPNTDPDVVLLIGLIAFFIIIICVFFLVRLLKKIARKQQK